MFAALRELAGGSEVEVDATGVHTVEDILRRLSERFGPTFDAVMAAGSVVVNGEPVPRDHALHAGDEVALLPPVSGGASNGRRRV
jgi:MoaD family protein